MSLIGIIDYSWKFYSNYRTPLRAKTKGIWLWVGDFFELKDQPLVLLDTEGLSDVEKGDLTHDMNLVG